MTETQKSIKYIVSMVLTNQAGNSCEICAQDKYFTLVATVKYYIHGLFISGFQILSKIIEERAHCPNAVS